MKFLENPKILERRMECSNVLMARMTRHLLVISLSTSFSVVAADTGQPSDSAAPVKFNGAFIHGLSVDVSRFQEGNPNPEGEFPVQISVNGEGRGQHNVLFVAIDGAVSAQPCFTHEALTRLGIKTLELATTEILKVKKAKKDAPSRCAVIGNWVPEGKATYLAGDFHLDIDVPQAYQVKYPRGYTDPNSWDSGVSVGVLDYNANLYTSQTSRSFRSRNWDDASGNMGLLAGLNLYGWRLRKRMNTNWTEGSSLHTQNLLTWAQRDVPVLRSQLTLGDSTTSGYLFDSLTVRGIQLQSDDRMLPDGLRYYSPALRGTAETNARVRVTQRGRIIYETTVPPGPFELSDIGALGYGGDLLMTVTESDGRERTQIVPFSSPPMLLREGVARFGVTIGKLQDDSLITRPGMMQGFYQYGIGNLYTLYGGGQLSDNYYALGVGHAFNTGIGGVSMDVSHARSDLGNGKVSNGNSFNIGYSKYFSGTDTTVTVAAYRYSSKEFYSLRDAAFERYGVKADTYRVDYRTRQRFTATLGQSLWNGARLSFSGSFYRYWDGREKANLYTLSYNKSERYFSWSVAASRSYNSDGENVDNFTFSVSIPLGNRSPVDKSLFSSLYSSVTHGSHGSNTVQANIIGSHGDQNELAYGVGTSVIKSRDSQSQSAVNGNIYYSTAWGQFGSTASVGNEVRQFSLSANGSVVAHQGGVTLGPRLGEYPFALVNAPGAAGARMNNGYGSHIDGNGYAIVPSLTPYRNNSVVIETKNLPDTVDLLENENTVIPQMGAAVMVNVKTRIGAPLMLTVRDAQGAFLPIGTDLFNEDGTSLGIVGQGGMTFVRGWQAADSSLVVKDAEGNRVCHIGPSPALAKTMNNAGSGAAVSQAEVVCR